MKKVMLDIKQVREGMVIAKDVFSNDGTLLIPKHSNITPNQIVKINVYNIDQVVIFTDDDFLGPQVEDPYAQFDKELLQLETEEEEGSIRSTKAFRDFSEKYTEQLSAVENQLNTIVHTGNVDTAPIYDLVNEIMVTTASTNNFFSFMFRMKNSDDVTYSHSMNVSMLASILGKWLNLPLHTTVELAISGLLHDIGKVKVNPTILNKQSGLTDEEFDEIKQHTTLGYEVVADSELPLGVKHAILMHHEKMNGAGYPLGLSWNRIHDYAKVVSIVDIYDAMTAERPYHRRYHPFHVIKMFEEECYGILDTDYLYVFLEHIAHKFIDDPILLSNGNEARIIFIHHRNPSRPIVQLENGNIIDLLNNTDVTISEFL